MKKEALKDIFILRMCIGYLGESDQYSWWPSSFFSPTSSAFLSPAFGKTSFFAQYYGVRESASIVHDEHIGIGKGVFHLFRLPETHEIEMHRLLDEPNTKTAIQELIKNKEAAEQFLSKFGKLPDNQVAGPLLLDDTTKILIPKTREKVAGQYAAAFKNGYKAFPYFTTA